jgi:hypothetical protein
LLADELPGHSKKAISAAIAEIDSGTGIALRVFLEIVPTL